MLKTYKGATMFKYQISLTDTTVVVTKEESHDSIKNISIESFLKLKKFFFSFSSHNKGEQFIFEVIDNHEWKENQTIDQYLKSIVDPQEFISMSKFSEERFLITIKKFYEHNNKDDHYKKHILEIEKALNILRGNNEKSKS